MIQKQEILDAQQAWKGYVLSFAAIKDDRARLEARAREFYHDLYQNDHLSFKPTKAAVIPFRNDEAGFLSYFINGNADYPEDSGFVLGGFRDIVFANLTVIIKEHFAIASGIYTFMLNNGDAWPVEYTFVYEEGDKGLKIVAHHSSAPFSE